MKTESIIFDLDGTLWDSSDNVAASWNEVVWHMNIRQLQKLNLTGADMRNCMGLAMNEIAAKLFPELSGNMPSMVLEKCMSYENEYISVHGGYLFENEKKILEKLSADHRLFIVSNCQNGYIEAFLKFSGFGCFFTDFMCWGDTKMPKSFTIKMLMQKNGCENAVYVGDTQGDCDAAADAGIPFIHAAYGFGKNISADKKAAAINSFDELLMIMTKD